MNTHLIWATNKGDTLRGESRSSEKGQVRIMINGVGKCKGNHF